MLDPVAIGHRMATMEVISDEQPRMVSGSDGEDGGGCRYWPGRRVRHDRGACRGVTVAQRVPGCWSIDQRITVDAGADHAESWQWLGHDELPEHVGDRP